MDTSTTNNSRGKTTHPVPPCRTSLVVAGIKWWDVTNPNIKFLTNLGDSSTGHMPRCSPALANKCFCSTNMPRLQARTQRKTHLATKVVLRTWRNLTLPGANRDATCRKSVTGAPVAREISKVVWKLSLQPQQRTQRDPYA